MKLSKTSAGHDSSCSSAGKAFAAPSRPEKHTRHEPQMTIATLLRRKSLGFDLNQAEAKQLGLRPPNHSSDKVRMASSKLRLRRGMDTPVAQNGVRANCDKIATKQPIGNLENLLPRMGILGSVRPISQIPPSLVAPALAKAKIDCPSTST